MPKSPDAAPTPWDIEREFLQSQIRALAWRAHARLRRYIPLPKEPAGSFCLYRGDVPVGVQYIYRPEPLPVHRSPENECGDWLVRLVCRRQMMFAGFGLPNRALSMQVPLPRLLRTEITTAVQVAVFDVAQPDPAGRQWPSEPRLVAAGNLLGRQESAGSASSAIAGIALPPELSVPQLEHLCVEQRLCLDWLGAVVAGREPLPD